MARDVASRGYTPWGTPAYLASNPAAQWTMTKLPFERPHILELWPRSFAMTQETMREIAPPLYGPVEEEARARGEPPTRRAEFLASWRLDAADEPIVRTGRKRTLEEARHALDRLFGTGNRE
jgi:hypothetical protein